MKVRFVREKQIQSTLERLNSLWACLKSASKKALNFSHVADLDYQAEVSEHEYQTQNERVSGNVSVREGEEGSS